MRIDLATASLLFQEMRTELATLAHHCCDIDKYRVETCCIIGESRATNVQRVFCNLCTYFVNVVLSFWCANSVSTESNIKAKHETVVLNATKCS